MMIPRYRYLRVVAMLWVAATSLFGENFLPPAEGPVAFRRDRIPLDADSMATLSRQLITLAEGLDGTTPASRRGAAQMLALSTTLDPSNNKARALIARFQKKDFHPTADDEQLQTSRERVWKILEWLSTPEAGEAGNALAACLTDVIVVSDPKYPTAENLLSKGERGAWTAWVPDLAAYEEKALVKIETPEVEVPKKGDTRDSSILLAKAEVFTPLWKKVGPVDSAQWILAPGALEMTAEMVNEPDQPAEPFSIIVDSQDEESSFNALSASILRLMKQLNQGSRLPEGGRVTIGGQALGESSQSGMRQSISAAAAVLASAALTGNEPKATIIGVIDQTGKFALPSGFWDQLLSLTTGEGRKGRLILPAAAADYLPSLLALEKPQFFFDYEVILASNFAELLALSAKIPDERFAKISASFQEIRAKATPQTLGQYLANPFVRRRLVEVTQEAPNHYSAKLLAIQGAGNRPIFVPRNILESEIRRAIKPIEWIVTRDSAMFDNAEIAKIGTSYESSRGALEILARYVEKSDRGILDKAQELVAKIRTMERIVRKKPDFDISNEGIIEGAFSEYAIVVKAYQTLLLELGKPLEGSQSQPSR